MNPNIRHSSFRIRHSRKGFTLMEMILVLAIIAVLVGGGVALMVGVLDDAGVGRAKGDIQTIETAVIRYRTLTGQMPSAISDMVKAGGKLTRPLLKEAALKDPWKQDYIFRNPGKRNPQGYDIYSKGPDMQDGSADDIGNWE